MLKPLSKKSLSTKVFEQLRDLVVSGEVAAGERLPAERVLAEELGVNRAAVREGLKRLEQAGLVSIRQGGGTRVLDYEQTAGLELLASLIVSGGGVQTTVARSVIEMRSALGPTIARLAADRADDGVCEALSSTVDQMQAAGSDLAELQRLAMTFWSHVVDGTGNIAYRLAYNSLDATYGLVQEPLRRVLAPELTATDLYRACAEAIAAGDGERAAERAAAIVQRGADALNLVLDAIEHADDQDDEETP